MTTDMRKLIMITEGVASATPSDIVVESYYYKTGKYTTEYDSMYDRLVPTQGPSLTLQGEILRAISKIYFDYMNNGFGNNWAPVLQFLIDKGMPTNIANYLSNFAVGDTSVNETDYDQPGENDEIMERMIDWGVKLAMDTDPKLPTDDMWDTHVTEDFPTLADDYKQEEEEERVRREEEEGDEYDDEFGDEYSDEYDDE
jgi:hypothetical protein